MLLEQQEKKEKGKRTEIPHDDSVILAMPLAQPCSAQD